MSNVTALDLALLPGARALLAVHARELPQRDDLCGAFCGALALQTAGIERYADEPVDQDAVALRAGSVVSRAREPGVLPHGEPGRRDYRLSLPSIDDADASGTTAAGLVTALEELAGERLAAIPFSGPWTADTLGRLFDVAAARELPVTLIANLATRYLWGGQVSVGQVLDYLLDGVHASPEPDWDVGHFACVVGRVRGPGGSLYGVADTYPSLGRGGVHIQPAERLAAAIDRRDMPAGGVIAVVCSEDAQAVRAGAQAIGLVEGLWDNGTATLATPR
ncbi:MAG TPA: hypothetical protein VN892_17100 [Solirubrobacteraceae bacterium]|nr:hypothetical protein [Solirubrobacteraceae bacterium]